MHIHNHSMSVRLTTTGCARLPICVLGGHFVQSHFARGCIVLCLNIDAKARRCTRIPLRCTSRCSCRIVPLGGGDCFVPFADRRMIVQAVAAVGVKAMRFSVSSRGLCS